MKFNKALILGVMALSAASMASAQTYVYVTGSTAFRKATSQAIINLFDASPAVVEADDGGGNNLTANHQIYSGNISSSPYIIKTSWSGSAAGCQAVSQGIAQAFIPDAGLSSPGGSYTGAINDNEVAQIAMSDVWQSSTPFQSPVLTEDVNSPVGVIPFIFVRNHGSPSSIANMTPQLARYQWTGLGQIPLFFYSSNPADTNTLPLTTAETVFATGRNPDSGTRITFAAETGVGVFKQLTQYKQTITGANGSGTITGVAKWPADNVNGIAIVKGNSGESSGGTLAKDMENNANGFNMVAYLGESDATTLFNFDNTTWLTYNGVAFSHTTVIDGEYTFWGYEHVYYLNPTIQPIADQLAALIAVPATADLSGIDFTVMAVQRQSDGGTIAAKYF